MPQRLNTEEILEFHGPPQHPIRNLSIRKYGEIYGPCRAKTFRLIKDGELVAVRDGGRTYVTVESAEARRKALIEASQAAA